MYDVNYHKAMKRAGLTKAFANGVGIGIISQFFADIIYSLLNDNITKTDIVISDISLYYASASAGAIAGILGPFMDRFAVVAFSTTTFVFVNNIMDDITNKKEFNIDSQGLIFDILLTEIVIYCFDKKAINDYYNHYFDRKMIEHPKYNSDKTSFEFLFVLAIVNLLNFNPN